MKELENSSVTPVSTKVTPSVNPIVTPVSTKATPSVDSTVTPVSTKVTPHVDSTVTPVSTKVTPSVDSTVTPVSTKATPPVTPVSTKVTPPAMSTPVTSNWNEQKSKLKAKFATLTDSDLYFDEGKKEAMLTKVQNKLGKTKEEFQKIIANL
jgi:uncharacterized protein YjbJ (UPF0337 family)